MDASGLMENTWLIVTSDHGQMFERGVTRHNHHLLFEPVIRVPLVVFEPGRQAGVDVGTRSSAIDVLPTLAFVTGYTPPDPIEGVVLPPYAASDPDPGRCLYGVQGRDNVPGAPIYRATLVLVKGRYKIIDHLGYPELGVDELVKEYDLVEDQRSFTTLRLRSQLSRLIC